MFHAKETLLRVLPALAAVALSGGLALAQDRGTRVPGTGLATTQRPSDTRDASPEFLARAEEHDPEQGIRFDGIEHYELRQGNRPDDKQRWKDTDFIHWTAFGATLLAEGEIHDREPDRATIASSEAWGMQVVEARIESGEGSEGVIRAENEIGFDYRYLVTGERIAEASVQLTGNAFDIHGTHHSFDLSDQRSETVSTEVEVRRGLTLQTTLDFGTSATLSAEGLVLGAKQALGLKLVKERQLLAKVVRRCASAGGDNDSTERLVVRDEVRGAPPLARTYVVASDGAVQLRARAGRDDADEERRFPVYVQLQRFQVSNELRVWTSVTESDPQEPPIDPPPPGAEPAPGPSTPDTPDDPADPGDSSPAPQPGGPDGGRRHRSAAAPLPGIDGCTGVLEIVEPFGLEGDAGSLPGMVAVGLDGPVDRDLVFVAHVDPPDAAVFADGLGRITVPAGARWGSLPIHAAQAGTAALGVQLLDEAGAPWPTTLSQAGRFRSTAEFDEPVLWVAVGERSWRPGAPVFRRFVADAPAPALRVGRLGFTGFATAATTVSIACDDPDSVLDPLPASVTIGPGELWESVPLGLRGRAGTARLTLAHGSRRIEATLQCVEQAWSVPAQVRLPAGATGMVPVELGTRAEVVRPLLLDPGPQGHVLAVLDPTPAAIARDEPAWFFELRGVAPGESLLELASPGLPTRTVPVTVVPPEVAIDATGILLRGLDPAAGGSLLLLLPEGSRFADVAVPPELAAAVIAEAPTPRVLAIELRPHPERPSEFALPCRVEGPPGAPRPAEVTVLDTVHGVASGGMVLSYRIPIGE